MSVVAVYGSAYSCSNSLSAAHGRTGQNDADVTCYHATRRRRRWSRTLPAGLTALHRPTQRPTDCSAVRWRPLAINNEAFAGRDGSRLHVKLVCLLVIWSLTVSETSPCPLGLALHKKSDTADKSCPPVITQRKTCLSSLRRNRR